jgi:ABC-2 type transport system permease protein
MRGCCSVFKRELIAYFSTPVAYVFLVIFVFFASFLTFQSGFFEARQASLRLLFQNIPLLMIFLVPAIAMRLWAEEHRTNSIEFLFSLPVTVEQAVLGKFFAAWTVIGLALLLTAPMIVTVSLLGDPDPGPIVAGYVGSFLLGGAYLGIGSFFSSISRSQVIAFVLSVVACAVFLYAGSPTALDYASSFLPAGVISVAESLSFMSRFESMQRGVIELRDVVFFVGLAAGWLWANIVILRERIAAG